MWTKIKNFFRTLFTPSSIQRPGPAQPGNSTLPPAPISPAPMPPSTKPTEGYMPLSWEHSETPERAEWSQAVSSLMDSFLTNLEKAADLSQFFPKYNAYTRLERVKAWAELWVATAYYESGWNPKSASVDVGTANDKDTYSVGLWQMSVIDQQSYNLPFGYHYYDLLTVYPNAHLSIAILARQCAKRGKIVVDSSPYWAVLYHGNYDRVNEIKKRVYTALYKVGM